MAQLILTGDVNLMNVTDPTVPFRKVIDEFKAADVRFSNMECCLYAPPTGQVWDNEGFMAAPGPAGESLKYAGIDAVGIANNVNYGEAAINASVARLDEIGVQHTGAGANRTAAYAPVIIEKNGVRYGFLQRTSVYWPTNHEATAHTAGVATLEASGVQEQIGSAAAASWTLVGSIAAGPTRFRLVFSTGATTSRARISARVDSIEIHNPV